MLRRTVLKLFGAGAGAAVAPWALEAKPQGPPPVEFAKRDPSEFGVLFVTNEAVVWGPAVESIEYVQEQGHPFLKLEFAEWNFDRCLTLKGCHLIHKPTRRKFDYKPFNRQLSLVWGDSVSLTYSTPASLDPDRSS
jgi:hypothetical protein